MSDVIQLPELPSPRCYLNSQPVMYVYERLQMQNYARAAVLADRERRAQPAPGEWQPIETAPQHTKVLIAYQNELGKSRVVKARFVPRFSEESCGDDDGNCSEYDEANDRYTVIEGWYEQIDNWGDYSEVFIHYTPTHWQPLPEPPEGEKK